MSDSVYERLQAHLNAMPVGFPKTKSGVEIAILKKIFDPEEAEMATHLSPGALETVDSFSQKMGMDSQKAEEWLERMVKKGQILKINRGAQVLYNAVQFVPGIWEHQLTKLDQEQAEMTETYFNEAMGKILNDCEVPLMRILPVDENIPATMEVLPYQKVKELIRTQTTIALADCICRKERRLAGHSCDHIDDVCLIFSHMARYYVENGLARFITAEEAIDVLDRSERDGLVHSPNNSQHPMALCNCCGCCCVFLRGVTRLQLPKAKVFRSDFYCVCDSEACVGCGQCAERCYVQAIDFIDDIARVDEGKCIGCGLCVSTCPFSALRLELTPQGSASAPPVSMGELYNNLRLGKVKITKAD